MAKSEQINELALALSKVQGEINGAIKDAMNPHFKSKYADLTSCWEACREQLAKYEIAVVQSNDDSDTHLCLTTTLIHKSGQWIDGTLKIERKITDRDKTRKDMNAQEIGSAITYFRRYSLCSMVGICPEDDDANSISPKKDKEGSAPQINKITESQRNEIISILKDCDPDYVKWHWDHVQNHLKAKFITDLDESFYVPMREAALKNRLETAFKKKALELADKASPSVFDQGTK